MLSYKFGQHSSMEYDTIITNIQDINFQYLLAENFTRNFYFKSSNDDAILKYSGVWLLFRYPKNKMKIEMVRIEMIYFHVESI
jgi:hypothetical protein